MGYAAGGLITAASLLAMIGAAGGDAVQRIGLTASVLLVAAMVATACGQPGELGREPAAAPAAATTAGAAAPTSAPPTGPVLIGSGTIAEPVEIDTPGPAVFSVRTVVVPPGGSTGWHTHPGTETSIVTAGEITLVRGDDCEPETVAAGDAVFIADQVPHLARNDGTVPAEIVVTYLLAPGAPDRLDAPEACPAP